VGYGAGFGPGYGAGRGTGYGAGRVGYGAGTGTGYGAGPGASGGAAAFSPSDLATLRLWLKADGANYQDSGRTTLATADTDPVGSFTDFSSFAEHFSQATAGFRPTLQTNELNSLPAVAFAGTDDVLNGPDLSALTAAEVFVVFKVPADPTVGFEGAIWKFGTDAAASDLVPFTDGNVYDGFGSTARKSTGNPTDSLAAYVLYNIVTTATEWTSFINGTQHFTTATNTVGFSATPTLGANVIPAYSMASVCELILCSAKLSAGDKTSVKSYIATKYGLTLA
jgi:hypothetical protein